MELVRKNLIYISSLLAVLTLFLVFRLPNLTLQPIFADEAIYIRWAQIMKAEPSLRFLPVSDGKTPLYMWSLIPLFKVFDDPLLAGRFLSVFSGSATLIGGLFLGWKFFNKRVGLWAAFLIAITPYTVFFDRMALVDSMLAAFSIWSLNVGLLLVRYERVDLAFILGYLLGGGLLTKPPAFFNILSLPFTLLFFDWKFKDRDKRILKIFSLFSIAILTALVIYNILRLGPGFTNLNSRNQDYVFSPDRLLTRPLDPFIPHLHDVLEIFPLLLTVPILIFILAGVGLVLIKTNRVGIAILIWVLIPLLIQMALLQTFTARYLLISIAPLLVLAALAIDYLTSVNAKFRMDLVTIFLLLISPIFFNYHLLTNPANTPLPKAERRGYLEDWTAGYGLKEIAQYLINEAGKEEIIVATEGSFGTLPDGLQIYLEKYIHSGQSPYKITVIGGPATVSAKLREEAARHPTFFVANKIRYPIYGDNLNLIKEYPKVKSENGTLDAILFFRVFPEK